MKNVILIIIIIISIASFYGKVPPSSLILLYGAIAVLPIIFYLLKKNLVYSLLIWFIFLLFKEFGNFPIPLLPDISLYRMVWVGILLIMFTDIILGKRKLAPGGLTIEILMFMFCVTIVLSMLVAGTIYVEGHGLLLSYVIHGYAFPFSIFFLAKNLIDNEQKVRKAFLFFCIVGFYLGITGIFENYQMENFIFPKYIMNPNMGIHFGQARGPFVNANINGLSIGMILFTAICLSQAEKSMLTKRFINIAIVVMLITLIFTYNRASWIAFVFGVSILPVFFPKVRKKIMASILLLVLILFTVIGLSQFKSDNNNAVSDEFSELDTRGSKIYRLDTVDSILYRFKEKRSWQSRLLLLKVSWNMFLDRPLLGFGYQSFKRESHHYLVESDEVYDLWNPNKKSMSLHNTLVQLLVELGIVGFSFFLYILAYPLMSAVKLYRILPPGEVFWKSVTITFFAFFILYIIGMQAMVFHFTMFPNALYYLMAGIIDGAYRRFQADAFAGKESLV